MSHPQTREEAAAAHAAWKARQAEKARNLTQEDRESIATGGTMYPGPLPSAEWHTLEGQPTAWQSVPKPVRFAVWVWAVVMIVATASFIAGLALWIITAGAVLATM